MKMQHDTFTALQRAIETVLASHPNAQSEYARKGLSNERLRWDLYFAADGYSITRKDPADLNDNHIDTALRAIVPN